MYYSFPAGFAYFYDEDTREITTIALEGSSVTNDPVELKQLLGKPINSGYDGRDQEDYQEFSLGDNTLSIMTTKDGELSTIWFRNR
ncbi:hypothetical protein H7992_20880 [Sporosarcina sp. resist]|uniref:hypothetical protein n=1 Tax=Sporosarcina sp. resist TaxID=2762563 RepID=UPI00164EBC02|nr:hypothetical protein [Sporosarcina sp. resist]QNK87599.1 hypothetical protein H7992_20880 [Sporosarcina sp. resist]